MAAVATVITATVALMSQLGIVRNREATAVPSPGARQSADDAISEAKSAPGSAAKSAPASAAAIPAVTARDRVSRPVGRAPEPETHASAPPTNLAMAGPVTIGGAWRDMGLGACHLIRQTGRTFEVANFDPSTGELMSQGKGTVDGNHVQISYPKRRHPLALDLHVAPSGLVMYGKVFLIDGPHRARWNYLGDGCPTPNPG